MSARSTTGLNEADLQQLSRRGIPQTEIERQLTLLRSPPRFLRLVRPCTVGDGILRFDAAAIRRLHARQQVVADAGRFIKFVPASGAATRMFRELLSVLDAPAPPTRDELESRATAGDADARAALEFLAALPRFAFHDDLRRALGVTGSNPDRPLRDGPPASVIRALVSPDGLGYAQLPKGLLAFHDYPEGPRTAFEEHLVEAAKYVRDAQGVCRLHFTVSPEHRARFRSLAREVAQRHGVTFQVSYSEQRPSTDTVAVDDQDRPLRDDQGRLVLRPGGHGALIDNLNDLRGDLVYVKNIDNVQPEHAMAATVSWKRALGGYLVELQERCHEIVSRLRAERLSAEFLDSATRFAGSRLQVGLNGRFDAGAPEARRAWLIDRLSRPLRVCGVVPNTGEPGGGPFWVQGADGTVSNQIVETAQVDLQDPEQREILARATHFNPVDIVCALRDGDDRPFDLRGFVDPEAAIITTKSAGGRRIKVLERPGLWNGAMAGWNTVFVEVPLSTFSPVKSVLDLLRPEHQPPVSPS